MKIYIKHWMSTAHDIEFEYEIDQDKKTIEVQTEWFDSVLFQHFVFHLQGEGFDAVRDDTKKIGWTPYPPYQVFLTMDGLRFKVETHKLMDVSRTSKTATILKAIK